MFGVVREDHARKRTGGELLVCQSVTNRIRRVDRPRDLVFVLGEA
jgi:hypothetical protein